MLADVRDFAKTAHELVERDAIWTSLSIAQGSRESSEATVTLLNKAVAQMKC